MERAILVAVAAIFFATELVLPTAPLSLRAPTTYVIMTKMKKSNARPRGMREQMGWLFGGRRNKACWEVKKTCVGVDHTGSFRKSPPQACHPPYIFPYPPPSPPSHNTRRVLMSTRT